MYFFSFTQISDLHSISAHSVGKSWIDSLTPAEGTTEHNSAVPKPLEKKRAADLQSNPWTCVHAFSLSITCALYMKYADLQNILALP